MNKDAIKFITELEKLSVYITNIHEAKSYVYFVTDGEFVKIGKASNPYARLMDLQIANARKLDMIALIPFADSSDADKMEKVYHLSYKDKKIRGEWFDALKEINDLKYLTYFRPSSKDKKILKDKGSRYKAYGKKWYENSKERSSIA